MSHLLGLAAAALLFLLARAFANEACWAPSSLPVGSTRTSHFPAPAQVHPDFLSSGSFTMFIHVAYADWYDPIYHVLHAEDEVRTHQHWTGITNTRANTALAVGLPGDAAGFQSLPLDAFFNNARYSLADDTTPYTPPKPTIHHHDDTQLGPGDAIVLGKIGETHQHIQFSSGTWDPMVGLESSYQLAGAPWGVNAWASPRQLWSPSPAASPTSRPSLHHVTQDFVRNFRH